MDLPGIGIFTLDPAAVIPEGSEKDHHSPASGISFRNANITAPEDELIRFIQQHTGKMKPLAAADLDFFLTSGKQMLNIGKPFYIEGIGTLVKNTKGLLDFVPGEYSTARLEDPISAKKETTRKSVFDDPKPADGPSTNAIRQLLLLAGVIGGLVVIGWGGYTLYKRNTLPELAVEHAHTEASPDTTPARTDSAAKTTTTAAPNATSVAATPPPAPTPAPVAGLIPYKFVILETDHRGRAYRRYNQLLGFQLNIKMETKDSVNFKLFFPISALLGDTTHIKDSLADVYAARVTIER